jgi:hypothetical protein
MQLSRFGAVVSYWVQPSNGAPPMPWPSTAPLPAGWQYILNPATGQPMTTAESSSPPTVLANATPAPSGNSAPVVSYWVQPSNGAPPMPWPSTAPLPAGWAWILDATGNRISTAQSAVPPVPAGGTSTSVPLTPIYDVTPTIAEPPPAMTVATYQPPFLPQPRRSGIIPAVLGAGIGYAVKEGIGALIGGVLGMMFGGSRSMMPRISLPRAEAERWALAWAEAEAADAAAQEALVLAQEAEARARQEAERARQAAVNVGASASNLWSKAKAASDAADAAWARAYHAQAQADAAANTANVAMADDTVHKAEPAPALVTGTPASSTVNRGQPVIRSMFRR